MEVVFTARFWRNRCGAARYANIYFKLGKNEMSFFLLLVNYLVPGRRAF